MASEADHIALANKCHDALIAVLGDGEQESEWITTIAFYKAVQIVEAVFTQSGIPSSASHRGRSESLTRKLGNEPLFQQYQFLLNASRIARYLHDESGKGFTRFTDFIPADRVVHRIIKKRLAPLEQQCVGPLSEKGRATLKRI